MRLSYSLLEHYQTCEYRTKVLDLERCRPAGENTSDAFRSLVGQAAHAGQAEHFQARCDGLRGGNIERALLRHTGGYPEGWDPARLTERVEGMVRRWTTSVPGWSPEHCTPLDIGPGHPDCGAPLVDRRLVWKLPTALGVFDEVVIVPDLVCAYSVDGAQGSVRLYDWKWVGELDGEVDDSAYRYDLQSAIYQYVLWHGFGIDVRYHGIVQGLIEEPTPFRVNKDGTVSTRPVRNSWEEYVRACVAAGHAPDEIMRGRCLPTFKHHLNYRSRAEVDAIWAQTVVPLAMKFSAAVRGAGFVRRMSKFACGRCPVREDCQSGQLGQHADRAWNTIYLTEGTPS